MTGLEPAALEAMARRLRALVLRQAFGSRAHIGSALSMIDILACLYFSYLDITPQTWSRPDRDRFILSKGHGTLALYAVLHEAGFLPLEMLEAYGTPGCPLGGHPTSNLPGIELSTGALGHGLAVVAGMALAARMNGYASRHVVLMGDGELDEGSVWEAALFAAHQQLGKVTAVVDRNGLQQEGPTEAVLALEPLADKWRAFGWRTVAVDGHDLAALCAAFAGLEADAGQPTVIIANTVKGKGVSFMERDLDWHMAALDDRQFALALAEVEARG